MNRLFRLVPVLVAVIATTNPVFAFDRIFGKVVDLDDSAPLAGVRVVGLASGRTAWTASDGGFVLEASAAHVDSSEAQVQVKGGDRLLLPGTGAPYDWISVSGKRRALGDGSAGLHPSELAQGFGWIVSGNGLRERRWCLVRIGQNLIVREVSRERLGRSNGPAGTVPESLSVRLAGRAHLVVRALPESVMVVGLPRIRSVAGDFHTHTYLTDGSHDLDDVAAHAFGGTWALRDGNGATTGDSTVSGFGLGWFANSEHGGAYSRDRFGKPFTQSPEIVRKGAPYGAFMWRWQSLRESSWPAVDSLRRVRPGKILFQGLEWNVPSHEHASVGIIASDPDPISRFEFLFDENDVDTIGAGWSDAGTKDRNSSHSKALAGARWLREHHRDSSWIVINHPSRLRRTFIQHLRDLHDAGGPVFLGIEAIPGHQRASWRGFYSYTPPAPDDPRNARTFGGVDRMLAKVGGVMDAMWSEGRNVWVFANSDFHDARSGSDYYPGQYAKNLTRVSDPTETGVLSGLRSGATVAVTGDLVDSFSMELDDGSRTAAMGRKLTTTADSVDVLVRFHVPPRNALGDVPGVDHVDLIRGGVHDRIPTGDPAYSTDSVANVAVVGTVGIAGRVPEEDGWYEVLWRLPAARSGYFRVRGASMPVGSAGWIDSLGNPLCDELQYPNDETKSRRNLWFYSNPVFLERR